MSFALTIDFKGLCMFAPGPAENARPVVHVLLPNTGGGGALPHAAALLFDAAHLREGSTVLDGELVSVPLEGRAIVFPGEGADTNFPPQLVDLSVICPPAPPQPATPRRQRGPKSETLRIRGIDPDLLGADTKGRLTARVTLGAGTLTAARQSGLWGIEPRRLVMTGHWTIKDFDGAQLDLTLAGLHGPGEERLPPLHPIDGEIRLVVQHLPVADEPPALPPVEGGIRLSVHHVPPGGQLLDPLSSGGEHFTAFYGLLEPPNPPQVGPGESPDAKPE